MLSAAIDESSESCLDEIEMIDLRRAILLAGYTEFLATFDISAVRPRNAAAYRHHACQQARILVDFLYLNEPTHVTALEPILGSAWRTLVRADIAEHSESDWVSIPRHSLYYYDGLLFFADSAKGGDPNVYFGDDSIGLFSRIAPLSSDAVLDLCSGSGFQALCSARLARRVHAVEINPKPRALLRVNALLNGLAEKVTAFGGSLYTDLPESELYDLITANPPLVPFPDSIAYPFIGHGGMDGLAVTREIIMGLPTRLSYTGRAQVIALGFSDGLELLVRDELKALAEGNALDILVTIVRQIPATLNSDYGRALVLTASATSQQTAEEIGQTLESEMRRVGATHVAPYFMQIKRGRGRVSYQNFSRARQHGLWHVVG
jgi:methylase of polypeptide subunit release factors